MDTRKSKRDKISKITNCESIDVLMSNEQLDYEGTARVNYHAYKSRASNLIVLVYVY